MPNVEGAAPNAQAVCSSCGAVLLALVSDVDNSLALVCPTHGSLLDNICGYCGGYTSNTSKCDSCGIEP